MDRRMLGNAAWGFRELELKKQLEVTGGMGLAFHELGIANGVRDVPPDASAEELLYVKRCYEEFGIRLWCAATGNDFTLPGEGAVEAEVRKVFRVIDAAEGLGIPYLRIFAGFSPVEEVTGKRWDRMAGALRRAACYGEAHQVTLCIETHGGVSRFADGVMHYHSVTTQKDALCRLLEEGPEGICFVYDPANLFAAGVEEPEEIYTMIRAKTAYIHLKDFTRLPNGHLRPAACGQGGMDWSAVLDSAADFQGPVLFEYENPQTVEEGSRACLEYVGGHI